MLRFSAGYRVLRIIAALYALTFVLLGCSSLTLAYDQGPRIAYWWIDRYLDLDASQGQQLRDATSEWFDWHRRTQLPDYAGLLVRAQGEVTSDVTPAQICAWVDVLLARGDVAVEHALPGLAEVMRTITPKQIEHLKQRYAKSNEDYRRDYLQSDAQERMKAQLKRVTERAQRLYGSLAPAQRDRLAQGLAASPFDPQRYLEERERRQEDIVQTLVASRGASSETMRARLAGVAHRLRHSPDASYEHYAQALHTYNCQLAAQVHNAAPPATRQVALARLKGWESDVRKLHAAAAQ
jgi:hypothetical protein